MYNEFEWDQSKYNLNIQNHEVSFEEAATVFKDYFAKMQHDEEHSDIEDRFIILGKSAIQRILVVCFCYRELENELSIRIISARKANASEKAYYRQKR